MGVIKALMVTADIFGKRLTEESARMLAEDMSAYSERQVIEALTKCRRELKYFPTPADIISRLDDGRPGFEEAWSMIPKNENDSCVWTEEMSVAFATIRDLLETDPIAARMAFKEIYTKLVSDQRTKNRQVKWTPSLGHCVQGREAALINAVTKNLISQETAWSLLPVLSECKIIGFDHLLEQIEDHSQENK